MKGAIDLEGVLSAPQEYLCEVSDNFTMEEDFQEWNFDTKYDLFMDESADCWRNQWKDIPSLESPRSFDRLPGEKDILTARLGCNDGVRGWLDRHGFEYNNVVFADKPKCEYHYDYYVDDNPNMIGTVDKLYLYNQPWNADEVTDENTFRVSSFEEIRNHFMFCHQK